MQGGASPLPEKRIQLVLQLIRFVPVDLASAERERLKYDAPPSLCIQGAEVLAPVDAINLSRKHVRKACQCWTTTLPKSGRILAKPNQIGVVTHDVIHKNLLV